MKTLNNFLILSFFIFSIPTIGTALPKCGNTLHNCTGTYTWENGDKYVGDWLNNKSHGKGTYTWKNGGKYVGDWVDNSTLPTYLSIQAGLRKVGYLKAKESTETDASDVEF